MLSSQHWLPDPVPWSLFLLLTIFLNACNPFAPALEEGDPLSTLLGNPQTIEGFFTRFQSAYELRDISLYEPLLDSAFVFSYYDFNAQIERQWGFTQDLTITRRLFESASLIRLQWNHVIAQDTTHAGLQVRVIRSFSLTIALQNNVDVFRGDGNVNFLLIRPDTSQAWKLLRWRDESTL